MQAKTTEMSAIAVQALEMAAELRRCHLQWPTHRPSADAIKAADEVEADVILWLMEQRPGRHEESGREGADGR